MLPGGSAILMRNGKPAQMTFEVLTDRLSQPGKETHEERIYDAVVHVDGRWLIAAIADNGRKECGDH